MASQGERNDPQSVELPVGEPAVGGVPHRGTPLSLREVVLTHYSAVYRYAFRLAGNAADADDLVQQTFLIAQQKLGQLRDVAKVDRWLFAVLRNCFLKLRRRQQPVPLGTLSDELEGEQAEPVERTVMDREVLQMALAQLPDEFRIVLLMFYFDEYSYKEIAAELELPIGTVMSRLARAKQKLRQQLQVLEA